MIVLFVNIMFLILYAFIVRLTPLNKRPQNLLFLAIAFLHLMFLRTFMDASLFPDLEGYTSHYKSFLTYRMSDTRSRFNFISLELGWDFLNNILSYISSNSFFLFFIVSVIMLLCYLISIKRYSAIPWLSVFIIFCTVFYNSLFVLRQNLAIPICLMSIPYIVDRKPIKFLLITLLAVSIHNSALVWLLVYFVYSLKLNIRFYFLIAILTSLLYFFMDVVLREFAIYTTNILAYTDVKTSGGIGSLKIAAVDLSILLLTLYSFVKIDRITGYNKLFFMLVNISFFINLLSYIGTSFTAFTRLNLYFAVGSIFLIPNALIKINDKYLQLLLILIICIGYLFILRGLAQYGYSLKF